MSETLRNFTSEAEMTGSNGSVTTVPSADSISIAELQSRAVAVEWPEAIAVIQALCASLLESGDHTGAVALGSDNVFIDADGSVRALVRRRANGPTALQIVSDLMRAILTDDNVPTPLRLALSQAPVSDSLEEWSRSIAYFERPDRPALIRALYARAIHAPVNVAPKTAPAIPIPPVKEPAPTPPKPVADSRHSTRRHMLLASGAVAVAGLSAFVVWGLRGDAPATAEPFKPAVTVARSAVDGLASLVPFLTPVPVEIDEPPPPPRGEWIRLHPAQLPRLNQAGLVFPIARSLPLLVLNPAVSPTVAELPRPLVKVMDGAVYSAADRDVVPPISVYPRFPTMFPSHITPNDFAEFDVVVTEAGQVESVRARRVPITMAEALRVTMSLSAAKTWRFRPGLKDGEPVKYRQVVRILNN